MRISARNVLAGTVKHISEGPISTEVTIEVAPGIEIVAVITSSSAKAMHIEKGGKAYAVIKASSVMVGID